jgi:hypothetical protein
MKIRHLFLIFIFSAFICPAVFGQEMLGTVLGNYSGVNGIQLNPSSMQNSKTYLDINLLSGDFFVDNNYLYLDKQEYRFTRFFQSTLEFPVHEGSYGTGEKQLYQSDSKSNKNGYQQLRINGPGAMLTVGRHAFGLTTGFRSVLSFDRIPYDIANFAYMGLTYTPQQDINYTDHKTSRGAALAWTEIGLSYSYSVYQRNYDKVTVGFSARRLFGYGGVYFKAKDADYIVPNDTTLHVNNLDAEFGFSIPVDYDDNEFWNSKLFPGGGFGFDIGATYTRYARIHATEYFNHLCSQPYEDYIYRIGVALIDIGAIRFKDHAVKMEIDNQDADWQHVNHINFTSTQQFADTISWQFYGDYTSAYKGDKFYIWLPAALSVQFDYHYYKNWYVNGSFIYGVNLAPGSLTRPAQVSVTPRYETSWFEANLPVSVYDWSLVRMGLSLRIYNLTVGTEKLGQFFKIRNFSGLDFYFSIKYFFEKGVCKKQKQKGCLDSERKYSSRN